MSDRFAGKVGIITGAGSGIGKATIERFVNEVNNKQTGQSTLENWFIVPTIKN